MAGIANPNAVMIGQFDLAYLGARIAEVDDTGDGTNGFTTGGSGASVCPAVGVNTGEYSPKPQDWPEIEIDPAITNPLGYDDPNMGLTPQPNALSGTTTRTSSFVEADAETAPDAVLDAGTGVENKTGQTVPAGAWVWGLLP